MSKSKILLGVLGGDAAGTLLGMLFAPEKGSKTRKKIKSKSNDYAETLKEKMNVFFNDLSQKYESVWEETKDLSKPKKRIK
jgi:gas vesicle protein